MSALAEPLSHRDGRDLLRFLTCGSVDDGKSTLIGRLIFDADEVHDDQLAALDRDSRRAGKAEGQLDFALLVDGLAAEREQGITIDVAYRAFGTARRRFIVADTPGHEQYTRNMATGASTADLAVLLVDARKGVLTQTCRHAAIASLLGIRHLVLAVNKIDLVGFSQERFEEIAASFSTFAADLGFAGRIRAIPIVARDGDNVSAPSARTPWYEGPTLIEHLETVDVAPDGPERPFRMAVQWVNRPNQAFRGFSGTIATGRIRPGDRIVVARSGVTSRVRSIVTYDGALPSAGEGEAVTLTLEDEIDASRGDLFAAAAERPEVSDQVSAHVIWMHADPLIPGRPYLLKIGARTVLASATEIKHRLDVDTLRKLAAKTLELNEVGAVNLTTQEPIAFDPFAEIRPTGAFILIDRLTNATVGAGMIDFGLRRANNIHWQALDTGKGARAALKGQKPVVLWFTGLSGAGKSTVANLVEKRLHALGRHTFILDGDNVRHGLNRDLGFTEADRVENIRRVAETAKLLVEAGLIAMVSFISPFRAERRMARELMEEGEFVEIFVDTPLAVAEGRDPKGLYRRARAGQLANFTGIDSPYEPPEAPDIRLTPDLSPEEAVEVVLRHLEAGGWVPAFAERGR